MSMTMWETAPVDESVEWLSPRHDVWVARRGTACAGIIEFLDGHFITSEATGAQSWSFGSLLDAKRAIECPESLDQGELPSWPSLTGWFSRRRPSRETAASARVPRRSR